MSQPVARWPTFLGLFGVALATLMYEILLTRIFSVTMWYHFAFFAVSVAMFGMTFGAVIVYLAPDRFAAPRVSRQLALHSLAFSLTSVLAFIGHLNLPYILPARLVADDWAPVALSFVIIAVPFVFSGIVVSLALTRFPDQVSRLYAADLAGAAAGCVLLIVAINSTDGPTTVLIVAALAALASWLFALQANVRRLTAAAAIAVATLTAASGVHTWLTRQGRPLLRIAWVKGHRAPTPIFERWNSFSRIAVFGSQDWLEPPFGWGLSEAFPRDRRVRQLSLNIDAAALTVMTGYRGDAASIEHLKHDVTNVAHHLRTDARVLVIGVGGGRDVLAALAFNQQAVTGVEINGDILLAVNERYGDFTGHLTRDSRVRFVNDEARSYVARSNEQFDIIQASLIDTWAATSSGAFVFTENSLYTLEAWKLFLARLAPGGLLTFSRWYYRERPSEVYRLTALASVALRQAGVADPSRHLAIVRRMYGAAMEGPDGIGTILVSRSPFTESELQTLRQVAARLQFEVVLAPGGVTNGDPTLDRIARADHLEELFASYPVNISPPTDDTPFFFHMLRFRDMFKRQLWDVGATSFNMRAIYVLGILAAVVVALTLLCIVGPLALGSGVAALSGSWSLLAFFAAIGLGFMFVEISQMQRLIIFLGHPVYGLSVLLFSLLVSSGIGSLLTASARPGEGWWRLVALLVLLAAFAIFAPTVARQWSSATTPVRIGLSVAMLTPLGLLMGAAFPLGMRLASSRSPALTPWLWGVNGAMSVCASVFAVAISLTGGISATLWVGFACYVVAAGAFLVARRET